MTVKDINTTNIFNNATNPRSTGFDGLPLLSTQHPIQGGVQANIFNQNVQFSKKDLENAANIWNDWKRPKPSEWISPKSAFWKIKI